MIKIRNVPEELHRRLKARAAMEGLSLSDFLLREARGIAERPGVGELAARLAAREGIEPRPSPSEAVRAERDAR
jgi:plasmid stability protein